MSYEPIKYLYKAVASKLDALGYKVDGVNNYPRVEIHSFDKTPTTEKNMSSWEVTFVIDVITDNSSPGQSLDIIENIQNNFSEAVINFRTRSSKGGLGEGYDLLVIDEAQEYTTDQETALKYIVTDSKKSTDYHVWNSTDSSICRYCIRQTKAACSFRRK